LANSGAYEEAIAAAQGLVAAADDTENPNAKAFALLAYGWAYRDTDPTVAYDVSRRALKIAHDSGNRYVGSNAAIAMSRLAVIQGDPKDAFDFLVLAIRSYYDSGSFILVHGPLAMVATLMDRLGHYEPAATIGGFAAIPIVRLSFPEVDSVITHLREVLGDERYESLARAGGSMTNAQMATYTFEHIDQARAELS
jgi:hypothetical protein